MEFQIMKKFIFGVIIGGVIVVAVMWHLSNKHKHAEMVRDDLHDAAVNVGDAIREKLDSAHLDPDDIKAELDRTGKIVREKAEHAGTVVADAATDARITSTIKAKLIADPGPSSLSISVSANEGVVKLSGTASSLDNIRKAIKTAMDTNTDS
jgi:hypothetical protein